MRVVVVGPCASGKSTLVDGLTAAGYDASVVAQEHSVVSDLYRRTDPDGVIALLIDLPTLRFRRGQGWSEVVYRQQLERLDHAFRSADVVIDSVANDVEAVLEIALNELRRKSVDEMPLP